MQATPNTETATAAPKMTPETATRIDKLVDTIHGDMARMGLDIQSQKFTAGLYAVVGGLLTGKITERELHGAFQGDQP